MLNQNYSTASIFPLSLMAGKNDDVDKGSTRKTPGNSEGARPPEKEDYREIERENNGKNIPKKEKAIRDREDKE